MFFIVMIMIHVPGRFVGFDFPAYSVVAPDSVAEAVRKNSPLLYRETCSPEKYASCDVLTFQVLCSFQQTR
ncbi:hypothetical protein DPMN_019911 [Dreissena polymorpha]|uniref:Secreted protein n=2 Tax=Dreissena polymorpha TaxID=45954 RepID=A0A9D4NJA4_DREPO|nr:hypothetical protein DPMN_019911 [Dreissena polymorpha]